MSSEIQPRPEGLDQVLSDQVGPLVAERLGGAPDEAGAAAAQEAWPVYHLPADAMSQEHPASAVVEIGWRALVRAPRGLAVADLDVVERGLALRQVSYGRVAEGVSQIRSMVERLDDDRVGGAVLEERMLIAPASYFTGLWLHDSEDATRDEVIPTAPVPPGLEEGRPYPFAELCATLARLVVDTPP